MLILTQEEGKRRWQKVREAIAGRDLECLIIWGSFGGFGSLGASLRYLSNVANEGYLVFPLEGEPTLFTFLVKEDPASWIKDWRCGHPKYSQAMADRLRELHLESARVGIVGLSGYQAEEGFPHATYMALAGNFPKAELVDATDIVVVTRRIKSDAEIKCFEIGCEVGEKIISSFGRRGLYLG